ncbi:YvrJ family protein [Desulfitobacterium sp.]|uniref:YvrJ family protein n=1 Tax=Desulfitobacterium sp. TaxID=49981 RepID=UPI002B508D65|nr:YvrJ family protein [Desulfitobacterium sp.]HVJ47504.1 YvrJ family protein [Desulfitobacterium sp.]
MPVDGNTTLFTLLGNFGFPIAVSVYLLVKFEKKLDYLATVVQDLKEVVEHEENN